MNTEVSPVNGNGNGNGHEKIFDLKKIDDPVLAKVAPAARRECCRDTNLTEGARMFFCYLMDAALTFGMYVRRGMIKISDGDLAREFKVNPKTIRNWKRALAASGRIWITERWNKNSFPTTVYNITALVGQRELPLEADSRDGSLVQHETFANSNRHPGRFLQRSSSNGKFLCQLHGVAGCAVCRQQKAKWRGRGVQEAKPLEEEKTQESTAGKGPEENILPRTTGTDCRPQRQDIAVLHGNNLPTPPERDFRSAGEKIPAVDGKNLPLPAAPDCRAPRKPVAGNGKTGDVSLSSPEVLFKRSTGINALKSAGGAKKITGENHFLLDVGAMMERWRKGSSKTELVNSGGWWRMSYRANPNLMLSVLADVLSMVKEGTIKTNPGATAVDLWKRWGGQNVGSIPKQKTAVKTAA